MKRKKPEHHKEISNDVYIHRMTRQRDRYPCFDSLITMESNRYLMYFMRNWRFFYYIILWFSRVATIECIEAMFVAIPLKI